MKRVLALLVLATVAALVLAPPASAKKPIREFLPADDAVIGGVCDFDVLIEVLENKEFETTFLDREGNVTRVLVTGLLVVRLTNLDTGESLVANISGPGIFTFTPESVLLKSEGHWLLVFFPGDLGEGEPGRLLLTSGLFVIEFTEGGQSLIEAHGLAEDACELLA